MKRYKSYKSYKKYNKAKVDPWQKITNFIVASLEQERVPWRQPYNLLASEKQQSVYGVPYSGRFTQMLLGMSGYDDTRWITMANIKGKGGYVKAGNTATPIPFFKNYEYEEKDSDGNPTLDKDNKPIVTRRFVLRYYNLFNIEQTGGLVGDTIDPYEKPTVTKKIDPIQEAETILNSFKGSPPISHGTATIPCYKPASDSIHMPRRNSFVSPEEYYSTVFHEIGHSTGHESRLNRPELASGSAPFGSATYSKEELVAEFCAGFLSQESGIDNSTIDNSKSYIQGWAKELKSDKKLVVSAAWQGQKAAKYILGEEEK